MLIEDVLRIVASLSAPLTVSIIANSTSHWLRTLGKDHLGYLKEKGNIYRDDVMPYFPEKDGRSSSGNDNSDKISDADRDHSKSPNRTSINRQTPANARRNPVPPGTVRQEPGQLIVISPVFKMIFLTVVGLTVISGIASVVIAYTGNERLPSNQQAVFESMNTTWKLGLGAIFGLLGGKALS